MRMKRFIASAMLGAGAVAASPGTAQETGQGFCVTPRGATRVAESEADCRGKEQFVTFVGQQGPPGADGAPGDDGTSCSVAQGEGSATISCTDGTMATVNDGAEGPPGPEGPAGPPGTITGDAAGLVCELILANPGNPLNVPDSLDCVDVLNLACPCFTVVDIETSTATSCKTQGVTFPADFGGGTLVIPTLTTLPGSTVPGLPPISVPCIQDCEVGEFWVTAGQCSAAGAADFTESGGTDANVFEVEACRAALEQAVGPCT